MKLFYFITAPSSNTSIIFTNNYIFFSPYNLATFPLTKVSVIILIYVYGSDLKFVNALTKLVVPV